MNENKLYPDQEYADVNMEIQNNINEKEILQESIKDLKQKCLKINEKLKFDLEFIF